jgi:hypothetical protein
MPRTWRWVLSGCHVMCDPALTQVSIIESTLPFVRIAATYASEGVQRPPSSTWKLGAAKESTYTYIRWYRRQRLLPSLRVPSSAAAASAGLPLHLKPLVPCLGAMIPLHQFLGSLKKRSFEGADRHSCGCPQQLTIQRAVLFHGYAEVYNIPLFIPAMTWECMP